MWWQLFARSRSFSRSSRYRRSLWYAMFYRNNVACRTRWFAKVHGYFLRFPNTASIHFKTLADIAIWANDCYKILSTKWSPERDQIILSFAHSVAFPLILLFSEQQKNTCAHNNTHKAHANGIKKAKRTRFVSTRGMDPKFLRNQKFAKKYNGSKRVHD